MNTLTYVRGKTNNNSLHLRQILHFTHTIEIWSWTYHIYYRTCTTANIKITHIPMTTSYFIEGESFSDSEEDESCFRKLWTIKTKLFLVIAAILIFVIIVDSCIQESILSSTSVGHIIYGKQFLQNLQFCVVHPWPDNEFKMGIRIFNDIFNILLNIIFLDLKHLHHKRFHISSAWC